jgi:hypothetical protein
MGWGLGNGLGFGPTLRFPYIVPAAETEEGKKRLNDYYQALGRFVDMFARVETAVTLTLWHYAKTEPKLGKIIFTGSKIETYSTYIKQLSEATDTPKETRDDLTYVLQQLGIINGVRNFVLHYGAESVADGNAIVSNALKAKGEPTSFPISPTRLDQMTADLRKIISHLNYRHLKRKSTGNDHWDDVRNVHYETWQYKHPVPPKAPSAARAHPGSQTPGPKPPRPPRPSRASRRKAALDRTD